MKTLRNTIIIVLVVTSLGFVNLFAMKAEKAKAAKAANVLMSLDPKAEKVRRLSDEAIRDVLSAVMNNVVAENSGKVNIIFKVSGNKQVEVLNIFGYNPALVSTVKRAITATAIIIPEALEGKYMISVVF